MKPSQILEKARALIRSPETWLQGTMFALKDGRPTQYRQRACKWCSIGAFDATTKTFDARPVYDLEVSRQAWRCLRKAVGELNPTLAITKFNDVSTHAEVLSMWDRAVEIAKEQENVQTQA